jgi:sulfite dehydrogenase (cytochrome) subunit A
MEDYRLTRRNLLKGAGAFAALTAIGGLPDLVFAGPRMVRFPEKTDMILLTNRPPQLETPMSFFKELITPNEAVFVRWHISQIPTSVDLATWRLKISGNVEKELSLSMDDLKQFEKVGYTAVLQCSGNGRSFAEPRVLGGQWGNGAMANVTWAGARLKDILNKAGIKAGSVDISFNGLDRPPLPTVPDLVKSLPVDKALEDDIIVAYEMNGKELPMLNGFPARLVVPGWYGTYWVKSLSDITVLSTPFEGFWVKTAYRVPDTDCGCITPGTAPKKTVPITRMTTRTLIVNPMDGTTLKAKDGVEIMGLAFSANHSIVDVIVSVDEGMTWKKAKLGKDLGKYSWIQFFSPWKPEKPGRYAIMAKATNSVGESQPFDAMWNPPGYLWNKVEKTVVTVK